MLERGDFDKDETDRATVETGSMSDEADGEVGELEDSVSAKDNGRDVDLEGATDSCDELAWGEFRVERVIDRAWDDCLSARLFTDAVNRWWLDAFTDVLEPFVVFT